MNAKKMLQPLQSNRLFHVVLFLGAVYWLSTSIFILLGSPLLLSINDYRPNYMLVMQLAGIAVLAYLAADAGAMKPSQWVRFAAAGIAGSWLWCLVALAMEQAQLWVNSQTLPIWAYSWFSTLHLLLVDVWSVVVLFRLAAAIAQWPRPQHTAQQESPMKVLWLVALVCSVVLVRLYQASASIQHPGLMQWQATFQALAIFALPMALVGLCAYTLAPRSKHEKAL